MRYEEIERSLAKIQQEREGDLERHELLESGYSQLSEYAEELRKKLQERELEAEAMRRRIDYFEGKFSYMKSGLERRDDELVHLSQQLRQLKTAKDTDLKIRRNTVELEQQMHDQQQHCLFLTRAMSSNFSQSAPAPNPIQVFDKRSNSQSSAESKEGALFF